MRRKIKGRIHTLGSLELFTHVFHDITIGTFVTRLAICKTKRFTGRGSGAFGIIPTTIIITHINRPTFLDKMEHGGNTRKELFQVIRKIPKEQVIMWAATIFTIFTDSKVFNIMFYTKAREFNT